MIVMMPIEPLSREASRKVDQIAIEQFGMSGLVLMENAGRGCVDTLCELGITGPVVICCGKGNNAGDGFVIARHLDLRGFSAKVLLWCEPSELRGDARANFAILQKTGVPMIVFDEQFDARQLVEQLERADWIVDALLGTGAKGDPRPPLDQVIPLLNQATAKRLAIDLPSGLDCDSGQPSATTFRADHTCTFVTPKLGFQNSAAQAYVGVVHVIDIGVPRQVLSELCG
jgi:NAD(P)H-hydrate epimerase